MYSAESESGAAVSGSDRGGGGCFDSVMGSGCKAVIVAASGTGVSVVWGCPLSS